MSHWTLNIHGHHFMHNGPSMCTDMCRYICMCVCVYMSINRNSSGTIAMSSYIVYVFHISNHIHNHILCMLPLYVVYYLTFFHGLYLFVFLYFLLISVPEVTQKFPRRGINKVLSHLTVMKALISA